VFGISTTEFLVILAVGLLVIGPSKLPEVARSLGRLVGELKKATRDIKDSFEADENLNEVRRTFDQAVAEGMSAGLDEGVSKVEQASPGGAADYQAGLDEAEPAGQALTEAPAGAAELEADMAGEASTEAPAEAAGLEAEVEREAEGGAEAVDGTGPGSKEPDPA